MPAQGGTFTVELIHARGISKTTGSQDEARDGNEGGVERVVLWDRKNEGGFPGELLYDRTSVGAGQGSEEEDRGGVKGNGEGLGEGRD